MPMSFIIKALGVAWMILSALLILLSALTYAREADSLWSWLSALSHFFDAGFLNTMLMMAIFAPGYLIYRFGDRLAARSRGDE